LKEIQKHLVKISRNDVKITRIRKVDSKKDGILYQIVLDATPFIQKRWSG
jgi:hypothetical protein